VNDDEAPPNSPPATPDNSAPEAPLAPNDASWLNDDELALNPAAPAGGD